MLKHITQPVGSFVFFELWKNTSLPPNFPKKPANWPTFAEKSPQKMWGKFGIDSAIPTKDLRTWYIYISTYADVWFFMVNVGTNYRRKFSSQTSDNMDSRKAGGARGIGQGQGRSKSRPSQGEAWDKGNSKCGFLWNLPVGEKQELLR